MKGIKKTVAAVAALGMIGAGVGVPVASASGAGGPYAVNAEEDTLARISPITTEPGDGLDEKWRHTANQSPYADRILQLNAYSPSMGREIPLAVITAEQPGAPTIYALNGAGGAEQGMDWLTASDALQFYLDKNVNVVIPMSGAFSYYIDWAYDANGSYHLQGPQKWETFLTQELPRPLESYIGAGDRRAIIGYSMSATSSLLLAEHNPGLYQAVGSFSGCAATSTPGPYLGMRITMNRGGEQPETAFGPQGSDYNRWNDAYQQAEGLRGTEIYVSNGSGLAGETDTYSYWYGVAERTGLPGPLAGYVGSSNTSTLAGEGGIIEAGTNLCTHSFQTRMEELDIPVDWNFRDVGTHSWNYWDQDIVDSWPTIERGLRPAVG